MFAGSLYDLSAISMPSRAPQGNAPPDSVRVHLFGLPDVRRSDGRAVHELTAFPRRLAVVGALAVCPTGMARGQLCDLLWPDLDATAADRRLDSVLQALRACSLGIDEEGGVVRLAEPLPSVDLWEFEHAVERGSAEDAVYLYRRGDLLDGVVVDDGRAWELWVETQRRRIRGELQRLAARAARADGAEQSESPARPQAPPAPHFRPKHRRFRPLVVSALVLVGGLASGAPRKPGVATVAAAETRHRVLVLPFEFVGDPGLSFLADGIVDLLATRLDGVAGVRTVDPFTSVNLANTHGGPTSVDVGSRLAREIGADQFIAGSIVADNGRLEFRATLYAAQGRVAGAASAVAVRQDSVLSAVDDLARRLVPPELTRGSSEIGRIAAMTTSSFPALRAYLGAEQAFRRGAFDDAVDGFRRATQIDSTFALAWYRLSVALDWSGITLAATEHIDEEVQRGLDRLPAHYRELVLAGMALRLRSASEAEQRLLRVVADYPEDVDGWAELGEVYFHRGPWMNRPYTESRQIFERVVRLDPINPVGWLHLARIAAFQGRARDLDSLVAGTLALDPPADRVVELLGLRIALGTSADTAGLRVAARRTSRSGNAAGVEMAGWRVAMHGRSPAVALVIARVLDDPAQGPAVRCLSHLLAAHLLAAMGRWTEAEREIEMGGYDQQLAAQVWASLLMSPYAPGSPELLRRAEEALLHAPVHSIAHEGDVLLLSNRDYLRDVRREYVLGALAARRGDVAAVQTRIHALDASAADDSSLRSAGGAPPIREVARLFSAQLRARIALSLGDTAAAVALYDSHIPQATQAATVTVETYTAVGERYLHGLLLASRDPGRAERFLRAVPEDPGYAGIYYAPAALALAHIAEASSDTASAVAEYREVLTRWRDADAFMQPIVRDVAANLARLTRRRP